MSRIEFYRVGEPFGSFSNFSAHPVMIELRWPTVEHFFQAQKYRGIDLVAYQMIVHAASPVDAARIGRDPTRAIRSDWDAVRDEVMRTGLRAKVMQHADVRELLLSTGDAVIVEHTANDGYWGDGGDGTGRNRLGELWMELRDELGADFDELAEPMLPPWEQFPDIGRYSIGWRMGTGEGYIIKFGCWYGGLSAEGQRRYQDLNPPPGEWAGYWDDDD